jgi:hypothetical protein
LKPLFVVSAIRTIAQTPSSALLNAAYRDLVRTSLIVEARYLALGVMREYHHRSGGRTIVVRSYDDAKDQIDAIYASQRLQLPFAGVLLFGYSKTGNDSCRSWLPAPLPCLESNGGSFRFRVSRKAGAGRSGSPAAYAP